MPNEQLEREFENALIDVRRATNAAGLKIMIGPRFPTPSMCEPGAADAEGFIRSSRQGLMEHFEHLSKECSFLTQFQGVLRADSETDRRGELNWVENLILLAKAHQAALRYFEEEAKKSG